MSKGGSKARGLDLLRQVYAELYQNLGHLYSPTELLQAAQTLIDVSRDEYGDTLLNSGERRYSGYYSQAVDEAMRNQSWRLLENEQASDNLGDERLAADENVCRNIRRLLGPYTYQTCGYWG